MKTIFAALIASAILATPMAAFADQQRTSKHVTIEKTIEKRVVVKKQRWARGNTLSRNERRQIIASRDYRRHHLAAPRRGQQWVRVDNNYLLISAATGLIVGIAASR